MWHNAHKFVNWTHQNGQKKLAVTTHLMLARRLFCVLSICMLTKLPERNDWRWWCFNSREKGNNWNLVYDFWIALHHKKKQSNKTTWWIHCNNSSPRSNTMRNLKFAFVFDCFAYLNERSVYGVDVVQNLTWLECKIWILNHISSGLP